MLGTDRKSKHGVSSLVDETKHKREMHPFTSNCECNEKQDALREDNGVTREDML